MYCADYFYGWTAILIFMPEGMHALRIKTGITSSIWISIDYRELRLWVIVSFLQNYYQETTAWHLTDTVRSILLPIQTSPEMLNICVFIAWKSIIWWFDWPQHSKKAWAGSDVFMIVSYMLHGHKLCLLWQNSLMARNLSWWSQL
jgi:hypothetical protein